MTQGSKLTWAGYDFLNAVKDNDTWARTKSIAKRAGGWTADLLKEIAFGVAKQKVREMSFNR